MYVPFLVLFLCSSPIFTVQEEVIFRNSGCSIRLNRDLPDAPNQPLIFKFKESASRSVLPEVRGDEGFIVLKEREKLRVTCPGVGNHLLVNNEKASNLSCLGRTKFVVQFDTVSNKDADSDDESSSISNEAPLKSIENPSKPVREHEITINQPVQSVEIHLDSKEYSAPTARDLQESEKQPVSVSIELPSNLFANRPNTIDEARASLKKPSTTDKDTYDPSRSPKKHATSKEVPVVSSPSTSGNRPSTIEEAIAALKKSKNSAEKRSASPSSSRNRPSTIDEAIATLRKIQTSAEVQPVFDNQPFKIYEAIASLKKIKNSMEVSEPSNRPSTIDEAIATLRKIPNSAISKDGGRVSKSDFVFSTSADSTLVKDSSTTASVRHISVKDVDEPIKTMVNGPSKQSNIRQIPVQNLLSSRGKPEMIRKANPVSVIDAASIACALPVKAEIRPTKSRCAAAGKVYDIGFQADNWEIKISVCHNPQLGLAYYSKHQLYGMSLQGAQREVARPEFEEGELQELRFSEFHPNDIFNVVHQEKLFRRIFRNTYRKYFNVDEDLYLTRGLLAPASDFIFGTEQFSTYFYINVAPQWETINSGNWLLVENIVRQYAINTKKELTILTGTFDFLSLEDENGEKHEIYLKDDEKMKAFPVPKYLWKVIYDGRTREGLAFLTSNNPFLEDGTKLEFCNLPCEKYGFSWLNSNEEFLRGNKGITSCCPVHDLRTVVKPTRVPFLYVDQVMKTLTFNQNRYIKTE